MAASPAQQRQLLIAGIRGVPAAHGGFETFAHDFALYMVDRGWQVTVFCQEVGKFAVVRDDWCGVQRVRISLPADNQVSTILFDLASTVLALRMPGKVLVLGYNTAVFSLLYKLFGRFSAMNMDGVEWKRAKWGRLARAWFYLNEKFGTWFSDQLIADHPGIRRHLLGRQTDDSRITIIPYGARRVDTADAALLTPYGLQPGGYCILIARAEPENSILEIVRAFSRRKRKLQLVVLGNYVQGNAYHDAVRAAASDEVVFVGAIYDKPVVESLRFHSLFYLHGHTVGGTNPSLVEALAAGSPVIAHDNEFNRWVVGEQAGLYFANIEQCDQAITALCGDPAQCRALGEAARIRHGEAFTLEAVHGAYEALLLR